MYLLKKPTFGLHWNSKYTFVPNWNLQCVSFVILCVKHHYLQRSLCLLCLPARLPTTSNCCPTRPLSRPPHFNHHIPYFTITATALTTTAPSLFTTHKQLSQLSMLLVGGYWSHRGIDQSGRIISWRCCWRGSQRRCRGSQHISPSEMVSWWQVHVHVVQRWPVRNYV